nr:MaoC/PaaZ C-terminal domain-containing protein [Hoyosella rhizosphaerae]
MMLEPVAFRVTREDLVRYAGVSGDTNPIHWSESVAKSVGLTDVVAHGMLSMGLGGSYVTEWLGDPTGVLEYSVRFTSPVYVSESDGGAIEFSGKIKSVDQEAKTATIALVAHSDGKRIFGRATAVVQLS